MKKKEKKLYNTKKFTCPKGKHKNWHYLHVWWLEKNTYTKEMEDHHTVVECYGSAGKRRGTVRVGGYCKPFVCFDSESELFHALYQMMKDVDAYPSVKVKKNPWEDS